MLKKISIKILANFSRAILKKYRPTVVGITGSVGKTSAKEAIAQVLNSHFHVLATSKNFNNEFGVPLTILGITSTPGTSPWRWLAVATRFFKLMVFRDKNFPEILVLEMGADKPGDIAYLTSLAPCKVGVLTFISEAHTEFFGTLKKIAIEKRTIIANLATNGFAIVNYDNDLIMENVNVTKAKLITYGLKEGADLRATDITSIIENGLNTGLNFKVSLAGSTVPVFLNGTLSLAAVYAALAGLAVGSAFDINLVNGAEALARLRPLPGRLRPLPGIKKTLIIDDTYNASPAATKMALEALAKTVIVDGARRYAVLGDMLELGDGTNSNHREIGFKIAELSIDFLITVGALAKQIAQAAEEAGLNSNYIARFSDSLAAGKFLQEKLKAGDVVLVKGSQGMRMERIVKEVMAEPELAHELLVRQDQSWQSK